MRVNFNSVYPLPQKLKNRSTDFLITNKTKIIVSPDLKYNAKILQEELYNLYKIRLEIILNSSIDKGNIVIKRNEEIKSEAYNLSVDKEDVLITGEDNRGIFYGIQTLLQLISEKNGFIIIKGVEIHDYPFKSIRGFHLYLPSRENIPYFKKLIKLLAFYKYNTLFIEVGPYMKYKQHSKINSAWTEFAKVVKKIENRSTEVEYFRRSFGFSKNSNHIVEGGLEKEEVKNLVEFAKSYYFEVIPEVQSLSHSYYLTIAYPEIAENKNDPYPDTYCPSNPKTYKILFDVIEEVIEIFKPNFVHIGHDEFYTLKKCKICKKKVGYKIFAEDINKIYNFLSSKGIKVIMWGDKLLNITTKDGIRQGGVCRRKWEKLDPLYTMIYEMPATYPAINIIPKDILICDWFWRLDDNTQDYFAKRGFRQIFGNFEGINFLSFPERLNKENVLGAEVSNWCSVDEWTMAHDGIIFNLVLSSSILWNCKYINKDKLIPQVKEIILNHTIPVLSGRIFPSMSGFKKEYVCINLKGYFNDTLNTCFKKFITYKIPFSTSNRCITVNHRNPIINKITINQKFNSVVFLHTCNLNKEILLSYQFFDYSDREIIGYYEIIYERSLKELIPIRYGINIYNFNSNYKGVIKSLYYFTTPMIIETQRNNIVVYSYEWINPHPSELIRYINFKFTDNSKEGRLHLLGITGVILRNI